MSAMSCHSSIGPQSNTARRFEFYCLGQSLDRAAIAAISNRISSRRIRPLVRNSPIQYIITNMMAKQGDGSFVEGLQLKIFLKGPVWSLCIARPVAEGNFDRRSKYLWATSNVEGVSKVTEST